LGIIAQKPELFQQKNSICDIESLLQTGIIFLSLIPPRLIETVSAVAAVSHLYCGFPLVRILATRLLVDHRHQRNLTTPGTRYAVGVGLMDSLNRSVMEFPLLD